MLQLHELQLSRGTEQSVTTTIPTSAMTWVSGPNGIGKSTLLYTLLGELPPRSGTASIDGKSVTDFLVRERARIFAFAPQFSSYTLPLTVGRIISLCSGERQHSAVQNLGLDVLWNTTIDRMSGGERQRLGIAAALVSKARYVLLDEPIASQDAASRERVLAVLQGEAEAGRAIVLTSHIPVPATHKIVLG